MENNNVTDRVCNSEIQLEYLPCINYAMQHNNVLSFSFCDITNRDTKDWKQVSVSIDGELIEHSEIVVDVIPQGKIVRVNQLKIASKTNKLIELTERVETEFTLTISIVDEILFESQYPISLMAYDQWTGAKIMPELLAAFVVPNHPLISRVSVKASQFLETWTGHSALDEYQTKDPNRVRAQVAAIYEALRSESLVYCTPPASFEPFGQRIRMADKVLTEKLGTCMDSTLLFASCLEANGIHPLLVLLKGHIFVGAWLVEDMYSQPVGDDASFLLKGSSDGINEIVLVETTVLTASDGVTFEQAVNLAQKQLREDNKFELFVDVYRSRLNSIRPLPQRINHEGHWVIENEGVEHKNATQKVNQLERYEIKPDDDRKEITKQVIWERKLLDFSLRNNLINIRLGRKVIPFISFEIDRLEDRLQAGESYQILQCPIKGTIEPNEFGLYTSVTWKDTLEELVVNELKNKKLRSYLTDTELQNALKYIYRTSRTAIEENGANSLFLVLGVLKWYESPKSVRPRYAPVLLIPIDIVRKGGATGYVIRTRDEEVILNITLVELLKQQFNVHISGLDPLPTDESGVDVKKIFATIRTNIRNQKGWDIEEEALLGLFSFNKFVMWNDIHSNAELLQQNPVIASLMENRLQLEERGIEVDARSIDKKLGPDNFAIPVAVDSSQLEAVIEAGEGKSFILHGPPGTGKSQTITNMIANALYKGKRILFVAEKMAALSVVQNRLEKIGLGPFCLELHSNKVTKSHFLEQLQKAIEVIRIQSPAEYQLKSEQLFEYRRKLIAYMEELHRAHTSGLSLYDCITNYLSIEGEELAIDLSVFKQLTKDSLQIMNDEIAALDTIIKITGHPANHPLQGLEPYNILSENCIKIKELIIQYSTLFERCMILKKKFINALSISISDTSEGLVWMKKLIEIIQKIPLLNGTILQMAVNKKQIEEWLAIVVIGKNRKVLRKEVEQYYASEIFQENAFALRQEWKGINEKWFLPKFFAKRSYLKKLKIYRTDLQEKHVSKLLEQLVNYQQLDKKLQEQSDELFRIFGYLGRKGKENWDEIEVVLELLPYINQLFLSYAQETNLSYSVVITQFINVIGEDWNVFREMNGTLFQDLHWTLGDMDTTCKQLGELCEVQLPTMEIEIRVPLLLQKWLAHFELLKDWYQWCLRRRQLEEQGLSVVIDYIRKHGKNGKDASLAFAKGTYHQLALQFVDSNEMLRLFNGLIFEELIEKYKQLTADFQELSKKELYCRMAAKIPSLTMEAAANSEVGILRRNIFNKGRGTSIRRIIDQIPTLLPKLCPCMLMSPISVAQYIDLNAEKFDLVIFDEASQMPTSEAVGAIARGKALVVVGDPKQMPPTSFFSSSQVDEDEADFDDMESILDDCISLSMPSRYLTWHYRSKHESLISFSNSQYYEGRLYTFPSVDDRISKVRLVKIQGVYDKGRSRCNQAEAEAVVKEIIMRLADEKLSGKSIGVVSFSQVQQNLIEDLLLEELAKHPELEKIAYENNEPIFIKNLENVQGDERDVILFSVGYGPDVNGNVSMNFGPLNGQGGERRLNVAVSRARYEMIVFSTLRAEQIDLKRTKAKGVEGLKKFLEFAERGTFATTAGQIQSHEATGLIALVSKELTIRGYKVDTLVGRSNFKVDLAIIDPDKPDQYILGLLCDGKNYYETKTTRDREIVQPDVLRMLCWNIMRIWSMDWFENKEKVVERIIQKLESLKLPGNAASERSAEGESIRVKSFNIVNERIVKLINEREKEYEFANLPHCTLDNDINVVLASKHKVQEQLKILISVEQPITNTLVYKRICQSWSLARISPRLQAMIDGLLVDYYQDQLSDITKIYWKDGEQSKGYSLYRVDSKRDILDIPIIEVMNAARYAIEQQISMPIGDLKKVTSQILGFGRKRTNQDMVTDRAIQLLISRNIFTNNDGMISSH